MHSAWCLSHMELDLVVKDKLQKETGQGRGRARGAAEEDEGEDNTQESTEEPE